LTIEVINIRQFTMPIEQRSIDGIPDPTAAVRTRVARRSYAFAENDMRRSMGSALSRRSRMNAKSG
jgi:hypothetical protein